MADDAVNVEESVSSEPDFSSKPSPELVSEAETEAEAPPAVAVPPPAPPKALKAQLVSRQARAARVEDPPPVADEADAVSAGAHYSENRTKKRMWKGQEQKKQEDEEWPAREAKWKPSEEEEEDEQLNKPAVAEKKSKKKKKERETHQEEAATPQQEVPEEKKQRTVRCEASRSRSQSARGSVKEFLPQGRHPELVQLLSQSGVLGELSERLVAEISPVVLRKTEEVTRKELALEQKRKEEEEREQKLLELKKRASSALAEPSPEEPPPRKQSRKSATKEREREQGKRKRSKDTEKPPKPPEKAAVAVPASRLLPPPPPPAPKARPAAPAAKSWAKPTAPAAAESSDGEVDSTGSSDEEASKHRAPELPEESGTKAAAAAAKAPTPPVVAAEKAGKSPDAETSKGNLQTRRSQSSGSSSGSEGSYSSTTDDDMPQAIPHPHAAPRTQHHAMPRAMLTPWNSWQRTMPQGPMVMADKYPQWTMVGFPRWEQERWWGSQPRNPGQSAGYAAAEGEAEQGNGGLLYVRVDDGGLLHAIVADIRKQGAHIVLVQADSADTAVALYDLLMKPVGADPTTYTRGGCGGHWDRNEVPYIGALSGSVVFAGRKGFVSEVTLLWGLRKPGIGLLELAEFTLAVAIQKMSNIRAGILKLESQWKNTNEKTSPAVQEAWSKMTTQIATKAPRFLAGDFMGSAVVDFLKRARTIVQVRPCASVEYTQSMKTVVCSALFVVGPVVTVKVLEVDDPTLQAIARRHMDFPAIAKRVQTAIHEEPFGGNNMGSLDASRNWPTIQQTNQKACHVVWQNAKKIFIFFGGKGSRRSAVADQRRKGKKGPSCSWTVPVTRGGGAHSWE